MSPRNEITDVAVIGAGPAGLAAAIGAAQAGARVTVFDENLAPGGQLFKQIHKFFGSREHLAGTRGFQIGRLLLEDARKAGVDIRLDTVVYGLFDPMILALNTGGESLTCQAKAIVVATGAIENTLAFPGWTLPGVMGAGAAQTMINVNRVLPGKKVLVVGSGNVGLIVTYQLMQAGADVVGIVEALGKIGGYGVHSAKVRRAGVPIMLQHTVKEAWGERRVQGATIAAIDAKFQPIPGSEQRVEVDTICLAVGLTPLSELLVMSGVGFGWDSELGGHIPLHGRNQETTRPGIFVAGDVTGVEEASSAMEGGRLAGVAAAQYVGVLAGESAEAKKAEIRERLDALRSGTFGAGRKQAKAVLEAQFVATVKKDDSIAAGTAQIAPSSSLPVEAPKPAGVAVPVAGISQLGYPSDQELAASPGYPSAERLSSGPVAVIECVQDIPCDPCEAACPSGAIRVGKPITNLPVLDGDKCTGCGLCIARCPGLAIFRVDVSKPGNLATVQFPWEYLPTPEVGEEVLAVDRAGQALGSANVTAVKRLSSADKTVVVEITVPKSAALQARGIARRASR